MERSGDPVPPTCGDTGSTALATPLRNFDILYFLDRLSLTFGRSDRKIHCEFIIKCKKTENIIVTNNWRNRLVVDSPSHF